jgi:hypothetical protein
MFTPNAIIDNIQGIKRSFTNQVITDPTFNKIAHDYIDAQTEFAKMLANNALAVAKYSTEAATKGLFSKKV